MLLGCIIIVEIYAFKDYTALRISPMFINLNFTMTILKRPLKHFFTIKQNDYEKKN